MYFSIHGIGDTLLFVFYDKRSFGTLCVYIHTTRQRKRSGIILLRIKIRHIENMS